MVVPRNEPNAPPSDAPKRRGRSGWFLLLVLAIVIIAGIAMVANRPGAGMGGSFTGEGGQTRPESTNAP